MLTLTICFIVISLVVAVICYITTSNIIFTALVFAIYAAYFLIYQRKKFKKYYLLKRRVHSCYFFINSFIITLSVKESYADGLESALRINDPQLVTFSKELDTWSDYEKVKYLKTYFNLSIYRMFLNILEIYQDQGGNILTMSENLISESTRVEKTVTESSALGIKHLVQFIILWSLSFVVLLFMKFGVSEFYETMLQNPIFAPLIVVYFLLCLISIHFFLNSFTNLTVKEDLAE